MKSEELQSTVPQSRFFQRVERQPHVACLIVNWNTTRNTLDCIRHVAALHPEITFIIVDNGSRPEQLQQLENELPETTTLLVSPLNGGYGHGVNRGIVAAKADGATWAWLLNPDSRPHSGCLEALLVDSAGSLGLSPVQTSSPAYELPGDPYVSAARFKRGKVTAVVCDGCSAGQHAVDVVTGTGLLINIQAAYGVGMMKEHFFHYKEEFEFAEQIGLLGGLRLVCGARIWHERGASLGRSTALAEYYRVRNELLYLRLRYRRTWMIRGRTLRYVVRSLVKSGDTRGSGQNRMRHARLRGVWDGARGLGGARIEAID